MTWHDPEALRRRLARYFDTIPHLAWVGVASSDDGHGPKFVFGVNQYRGEELLPFDRCYRRERAVRRRMWRVARLLGVKVLSLYPAQMGPQPWDTVIYERRRLPCWRAWAAESERWRLAMEGIAARAAAEYAGWSPTHRAPPAALAHLRGLGVDVDGAAVRARARRLARLGRPLLMEFPLPPRTPALLRDVPAACRRSSATLVARPAADPGGSGLRWFEWLPYGVGP